MKYKNKGQALEFEINDKYVVLVQAKWIFDLDKYNVDFFIRNKNITIYDEVGSIQVQANRNELFTTLASIVESKYKEGFFNKSIKRYEYYIKALEVGIDTLEGVGL